MSWEFRKNTGETKIHRRCKAEIFEAFINAANVSDAKLERYLGEIRPDVSALVNGVRVAIEVQISNLSIENVIHRTQAYARRGIYVLWLTEWTPALNDTRYSPTPWERWLHAAYFGRVYYWLRGTTVVSYHFDPSHIHVERQSLRDLKGKQTIVGGYSRRSKRYRKPIRGETFDLLKHFGPREREWWSGGDIMIPPAKLFADIEPRFWQGSSQS